MATYSKQLHTLIQVCEAAREIDKEMPMQMLQSLLCVALRPGLTMQNLSEMTGLAQSSASRNIQTLGKWHRVGKPGYDLVEAVEDPEDTRRKIMFLTPKGKSFTSKLLGFVNAGPVVDFDAPSAQEHLKPIFKARMARFAN